MQKENISVLLIEDNPNDAALYRDMLSDVSNPTITLSHSNRLSTGLKNLETRAYDLVLLDLFLPETKGIKTLHKVIRKVPRMGIIALTRFGDEETGIQAVKEGALDYLVKGDMDRNALVRSIRYSRARYQVDESLREREEQQRRLAEKLQQANKELERFTYSVSHDLRAPLRAITGFSEILERRYRSSLDEKGRHYLNNIVQAGKQMGMLIDDLLAYTRLGGSLKAEMIPLGDVLNKVVQSLAVPINETGGTVNIPDDLPTIKSNKVLLIQIFNNLVSNALTFHKEDVPPIIDVTCACENAYWIITVTDNGIGIPLEQQDKIFKMFQRLHTQDEFPGTGIGLAIVKKAIDMHHGEIDIFSEQGKGSSFSVRLPVQAYALEDWRGGNE